MPGIETSFHSFILVFREFLFSKTFHCNKNNGSIIICYFAIWLKIGTLIAYYIYVLILLNCRGSVVEYSKIIQRAAVSHISILNK